MGTHPIFESDFDCLTECSPGPFARRVIPTSRRTVWSDVLNSHGTNTNELAYWSKINKVFMPMLAVVSIVIGIKVRHEHHVDRDPWNSAPWMNVADMSQPFEGKKIGSTIKRSILSQIRDSKMVTTTALKTNATVQKSPLDFSNCVCFYLSWATRLSYIQLSCFVL